MWGAVEKKSILNCDIFVGHGYANGASEGAYSLIQQNDGKFIIEKDDFYKKIVNWTPLEITAITYF